MKYLQVWKPGKQVSWAVTFTCELAFILFGVEQGIVGILILGEDFLNQFGHPTGSYLGIIVSIYTLGCFFGCVLNFFVGDYLGRRRVIALSMVIIIIGVALQCSSFSVVQLMIGRFITGLGTGMETSSVPMYQSELAKPHLRGRLVCSEALFVGIGLVYAYWLDYGFSFLDGPIAWRFPLATQILFAATVLLLTFTVPESPRYLYAQGKTEECKEVLAYVFGKPKDHDEIITNFEEIEAAVEIENAEGKFSWKRLFKADKARTRFRIFSSYMAMVAQQLSGINLLNYYISTVLLSVGLSQNLALILGGVNVICFTVGSLFPAIFADKYGRRLPMVYGYVGCFICFLMVSVLLNFPENDQITYAAVAFFFIFQLVFGASANCFPWVIVPELLPLQARSKGTAIGISANWLWNFVVVEITPSLIDAGVKAGKPGLSYIPFAVTNFFIIFQFYFFYPETKNMTLEKIDELYSENRTVFMGLVDTKHMASGLGYVHRPDGENLLESESEKARVEQVE